MRSCNFLVFCFLLSFVEIFCFFLDVDFFFRLFNFFVVNIDNGGREKFFNNFVIMVDIFFFGMLLI